VVRSTWMGRALDAWRADWCVFLRQMRVVYGRGRTRPGLYTYRYDNAQGKVRLHLRIHPDGTGALFANVADPIHLTAGAAEMARMILDGVPASRVGGLIAGWYPDAPPYEIEGDINQICRSIEALRTPTEGCPTCELDIARAPLFSTRAKAPYKADLALSYACNNDCEHCYNEPGRKGMVSLELSDWKRVLRKLADIGVPHLIFTGGEPSLFEGLPGLIRAAEKLGQICGINTNGRRLAEPAYARQLARAGLDHVQVTLASHRADIHNRVVRADAHSETVAGIRNSIEAGLHTITNTTLTRENRDHALEIVDFIHELGVTTFAMNSLICSGGGRHNPKGLAEAELPGLLEAVRERADELQMQFLWYTPTEYCRLSPIELGLGAKCCNAAEYSVCIEPNGDVLPCQSYYEPAGNILSDDWGAIWESELFRRIRDRRERPREAGLEPRCWDCPDLQVCGGGCPLRRAELAQEAEHAHVATQ